MSMAAQARSCCHSMPGRLGRRARQSGASRYWDPQVTVLVLVRLMGDPHRGVCGFDAPDRDQVAGCLVPEDTARPGTSGTGVAGSGTRSAPCWCPWSRRTEVTFEGSLALEHDVCEVQTIFGEGMGRKTEPDLEPLSKIIDELNDRFGYDLNDRDQMLFDQIETTWLADREVVDQARSNTLENFRLVFDRRFLSTVVGRMDDNDAIFKKILDDEELRQVLMDLYARRVYVRAREGAAR